MNNEIMQISHQQLKTGTLLNITNPKNKESITLKKYKELNILNFTKHLSQNPLLKNWTLTNLFQFLKLTK